MATKLTRRTFLGAVTLATVAKQLESLQARIQARETQAAGPLARLRADPARILSDAGMEPDPWQAELLRSSWSRAMLCCSRQSGKSQVAAAIALQTAFFKPGSLTLILSRTERQSGELFKDKLLPIYDRLGRPVPALNETQLTLKLANGSRIICLPGAEGSVRCFSGVKLLIVDEAAKVPDELYLAVRPMLAVSRGRLIAMSTPFGKRGWFYEAWHSEQKWHRVRITATQCPRITDEFLAEERLALGQRWFAQEYENSFEDLVGSLFATEDIEAALRDDVHPLLLGGTAL